MPVSHSKAGVKFIFFTILLDAFGMGLLIPVLPEVLRRFTQDPAAVSTYFGWFMIAYAGTQFLASPFLGSLSDRFGRRPILLVSLLGAAVDYLFMAYAPLLSLLFVGRIISGLTGASATVASSYMADVSTDDNRAANFGLIGAAWGAGFILGPILGGSLGFMGPQGPFLAAAGLNGLNFLFGLFVLPESHPVENRRAITMRALNPFASIVKILRPSPFVSYIWVLFILFTAGQVHPVNWTLYTETKFHWTAWQVGLSLSFVGVVIAISQGYLTRIITPRLGETRSFTYGLFVYVIGFALFGLATEGWMMYAIMAFFSLSGVAMPALQSMITKQVPANEQGELQGSLVSINSFSSIIAPLLFTYLFVKFTAADAPVYFPGAAYIGASALCVIALIINLRHRAKAST